MDVMSMRVGLNIFKASSQPSLKYESKCFLVDLIDEMVEEALHILLSFDPLGVSFPNSELESFHLGGPI